MPSFKTDFRWEWFIFLMVLVVSCQQSPSSSDLTEGTAADSSETAEREIPTFDHYPVTEIYQGPVHAIDFSSHSKAKRYRFDLQEGLKQDVNFAGHYIVTVLSCGEMCQRIALIDAKTGDVHIAPFFTVVGSEFRVDSRLFIANPPESLNDARRQQPENVKDAHSQYYLWAYDQFFLLCSMKEPMYSEK